MTNAKKDRNSNTAITGMSDANGTLILPIYADPVTHGVIIDDAATGTDFGPDHSEKDANSENTLMATSNANGTTPLPLYVNASTNALKIKST